MDESPPPHVPLAETRDRAVGVTALDGSSPGPTEDDDAPIPARAGPYHLTERIGAGGMGVVLRAHDPRLRRDVAIKLLRGRGLSGPGSEQARARLLREAQALARFSHPNVVQVFDVGTDGGRVWLAMELVEGVTAGRWARATPRRWTEVLELYTAAARGLAAAHAEGLVHRDFKPDNVFLGDDGRVRVGDFGLVRAASATGTALPEASSAAPEPVSTQGATDLGATPLTSAGFVLGTPAYMAPEQHRGRATDSRTDQFAWCVAVWEAVYGGRPFRGRNASELAAAKHAGPPPRPPDTDVPPWLHRVLCRGLAADPNDRFPTMEALLSALSSRRQRRGPVTVAAIATVTVAAVAGLVARAPQSEVCERPAPDITEWSLSRRAAIERAFVATAVTYAADTYARVDQHLTAYDTAWGRSYLAVCRATHVAATQSQAELDTRMRCLGRRRDGFEGVVSALSHADPDIVRDAVFTVSQLQAPASCETLVQGEGTPLPDAPDDAQAVMLVLSRLARHRAAVNAGDHIDQLARATALLEEAETTGWDPAVARAELLVADALDHASQYDDAVTHLEHAWAAATSSHDDVAAVEAGISLVWMHGRKRGDAAQLAVWERHVRAAIDRLGPDRLEDGQFALAQGGAAQTLGRFADARAHYAHGRRVLTEHLGPDHPDVATALTDEGTTLLAQGEYAGARARHAEAVAIYERRLGAGHPSVAVGLDNLANAEGRLGNFVAAAAARRRALVIRRRALGPGHAEVGQSLANLAATLESAGEYVDAEAAAREAVTVLEGSVGPDHPHAGVATINLASSLERQHRHAEALPLARSASATLSEALPPDHPYLAFAEAIEGAVLLGLGRLDEARVALSSVAQRCTGGQVEPSLCLTAAFELARVRFAVAPADRDAARREATESLAALVALPHALSPPHRREFEAWLADTAPPGDDDSPGVGPRVRIAE